MAYSEIDNADLAVGKPVKKSVMENVNDNLKDHETRISALAAGANKISVFEYYIDPKDLGIGDIQASDMALSTFQLVNGTGWSPADGSTYVGSVYFSGLGLSNVADTRDRVLRGLGPTYSAPLATTQEDQLGSHAHSYTAPTGGAGEYQGGGTDGSVGSTTGSTGGNETRMKNVTVNYFIKVNLSAQDNVIRIKAREAMSIVSVKGYIVDHLGLPTSGNFEFDIKKGATIAALSTIYTTKPTLAYSAGIADGDPTSSGTPAAGGYDVSAGDWLQLDVTSIMPGQSGVYIQVFAEPA